MYPKANFISRNADLFRRVCRLPLAAYEQSLAQELNRAESLFVRHCQNVRTGLSPTTAVPEMVTDTPARSPTLPQAVGEATSFPDALTGLVVHHVHRQTQAKRSRAARAA